MTIGLQRFNAVAFQGTFQPLKMTFSRSSKFAYIDVNSLLVVIIIIMMIMIIIITIITILTFPSLVDNA